MQVKLKVLVGKNAGNEIPINKTRFLIGRAEQCNLRPKSDAISRNHCAILIKEQEEDVLLRDLNSRNGTFVNGEKVSGDLELKSGDHLQIGKLEFEVVILERKRSREPVTAKSGDAAPGNLNSLDFDISEWLEESAVEAKQDEPETRQFKLDDTDRLALEQAKEAEASDDDEEPRKHRFARPQKEPGKLPDRPQSAAGSSREAAADMLKKFFNNR